MAEIKAGALARGPQGQFVQFDGQTWSPVQVAENSQTGERLVNNGSGWSPYATPQSAHSQPEERSAFETYASRPLGLTGRALVEGVGGLVDLAGAPLREGFNAVNAYLGGSPNYLQPAAPLIADALGMPKPETGAEQIVHQASTAVASAIPTFGAGLALQGGKMAASAAPSLGRAAGQLLTAAPITQAVSAGAAGAGGEIARQSGAGPVGQIAASLAAGMTPAGVRPAIAAVGRPLQGARTALDAFTPAGRERIAGSTLGRLGGDKDSVLRALEASGDELVAGSLPTTAQVTGDRGLATLEKGLASSGPSGAALQERYIAQNAARQEAMDRALSQSSPLGGGLGVDEVGLRIRSAYDTKYNAAKDTTRAAYARIDPEGTASFSLEPLAENFRRSIGGGRYQETPSQISNFMRKIQTDIDEGVNVGYRDLQDIRTTLSDMAETAARSGDASSGRIAQAMKRDLDNYLENSASIPAGRKSAPLAKPGSAAYRDATRMAQEALHSDPYYEDLAYLMKEGINKDAAISLIGKDGVNDLNRAAPGLIRRNGRISPDVAAGDLAGGSAYGYGGSATEAASGDALLQSLVDRLGPGSGRYRVDLAQMRDDILSSRGSPHTGFSPQQADAFRAAKQARIMQGRRFESGANEGMSRRGNTLEGQRIPTDKVPANYFRSGVSGGDSMRAFNLAVGDNSQAREAMKDYAVSQARGVATKPNGNIDLNSLTRWAKNHYPALKQLGLEDISAMPNIRADMARAQRAVDLAGVRGSPTAQNLTTQAILDKMFNPQGIGKGANGGRGLLASIFGGIPRYGMERLGRAVYGPANDAIQDILIDASLDPKLALRLIRDSGYAPLTPLSSMMKKNAVPRLVGGLLGMVGQEPAQERKRPQRKRGQNK